MVNERPLRETRIPSRFKDFITNFKPSTAQSPSKERYHQESRQGETLVIMPKAHYHKMAANLLGNGNCTPIKEPINEELLLSSFLSNLSVSPHAPTQRFADTITDYMKNNNCTRTKQAYVNPKIYKPMVDEIFKGRMVVDSYHTTFYAADKTVYEFCSPIMEHIPTIIQSSTHLIRKIRRIGDEAVKYNLVFITADEEPTN